MGGVCLQLRLGSVCLRTHPHGSLSSDVSEPCLCPDGVAPDTSGGFCLRMCPGSVCLQAVFIVWPVENGFQTLFGLYLHCYYTQNYFDETVWIVINAPFFTPCPISYTCQWSDGWYLLVSNKGSISININELTAKVRCDEWLPLVSNFIVTLAGGESVAFGPGCLSVYLFVRTDLLYFSPQLLIGLKRNFHHRSDYSCIIFYQ